MFTFMTPGERQVPPGLQRAAEGETQRLTVLGHRLPSCFPAPCGLHFPASLVSTRSEHQEGKKQGPACRRMPLEFSGVS